MWVLIESFCQEQIDDLRDKLLEAQAQIPVAPSTAQTDEAMPLIQEEVLFNFKSCRISLYST